MLSLLLSLSLFASDIYVFHDSSCMDKLSFKEKTLTADFKLKTTAKLISYNIKASENEIVCLEVSEDGQALLADMPIGTKNCHELVWDEQFVKEINAKNSDIFIVTLVDGKYRINPVTTASYFFSNEDELAYANNDFGFNFNQGSFDSKEDLLTYGLKSKVNFSFADNMHCPGEYHFYKSTRGRNIYENELIVVPQLGVIKNYTISKKLNRNLREVELQEVNDMPLATFLEQLCNKTTVLDGQPDSDLVAKSGESKEQKIIKKEVVTISPEVVEEVLGTKDVSTEKLSVATLPGAKPAANIIQTCHHIYRNADTGFYYNKETGLPANTSCGGIVYEQGIMQNSDYQSTTATTELISNAPIVADIIAQEDDFISKGEKVIIATGTVIETENANLDKVVIIEPVQKAEIIDSKPKVVYKRPKVIYKEAAPIIIDPSIEPEDSKIIIPENNNRIAKNLDCTVAPRTGYHLVKKGETLYKLSNMYNVAIEDLMQWNGLSTSEISVCANLRVQAATSLTQSTTIIPANDFVSKGAKVNTVIGEAPAKRQYHYISDGDTFYAISKKYNVDVASLKKLNNLNNDYLKPGWRLLIPNNDDKLEIATLPKQMEASHPKESTPKAGSSMKIPDSSETLLNSYQNQHIYHTVSQDETINDIAMKYGTSINSIRALNKMSEGEVLIPFQKIKVK